jgi:16S rRNA (cytosine967-C5)-methyltransferase
LKALSPELNELIAFPVEEKLAYFEIDTKNVFAFQQALSDDIDKELFSHSMFIQPDLFLRIRPGKNKKVCDALNSAAIAYRLINNSTIALENGVSVENVLQINKDVVVQDLNSQKVFDFFVKERNAEKAELVWDCCAASGGKSILLYDQCGNNTKLTVSDIRESILTNLQLRLKDAGINIQKKFVQDLTLKSGLTMEEKFSVVICDAPCSGSGTWSRTPEQYASFDASQIQQFAQQQQKIVVNSIQHLAKNGWFIYITCSVFKAENEDMVEFITNHFSCQLLEMKYLKGYNNKADTLFVAYFKS